MTTLVLLHGLTADGACWRPVARALEPDCEVVTPDARGHGSAAPPAPGVRYDDLAADVIALFDARGLASPVLAGHSMGGLTAAVVAARNPARVRRLVLIDPTFLSPERQREVHQAGVALGRSYEELLADLRQRHPRRSAEMVELLAQARARVHPLTLDILAPPNPDHVQLIDALQMPTLLVIGDSGVVSLETANALAKRNPKVEVELLANAGHGVPYDEPERIAALLRRYSA
ncbi:MAG: alpha/beta hydrolase [Myxococcaceae bacterium]